MWMAHILLCTDVMKCHPSHRSTLLLIIVLATLGAPRPARADAVPAELVDCTHFHYRAGGAACLVVANQFWPVYRAEIAAANAGDPLGVLAEVDERTLVLAPDGSLFRGLAQIVASIPRLFGASGPPVAVADVPLVRPLDGTTVLLVVRYQYTFADGSRDTQLQTSLYRRDPSMPNGWHELYFHASYLTPLRGDVVP